MNSLIKLSKKTTIALHALAYIAANGDHHLCPVKRIAKALEVSPTFLAKVLQPLVKLNILESTRGAHGGFSLLKSAKDLTLLDLILTINGPFSASYCLFEQPTCKTGSCIFSALNMKIADLIFETLSKSSLAEFSKGFLLED
ncbi:Rrf2 family transcriptional regulator [bacterium]|nr:Rrf2 family transcriptional regulator [bacterium]